MSVEHHCSARQSKDKRPRPAWATSQWWNAARFANAVQTVGLFAVVATLIFTGCSVQASTQSVDAAREEIAEARYQSVYERQLDLWQLAAAHPEVGSWYMRGEAPPYDPAKDLEYKTRRDAALAIALDFYAYVWAQQAPFRQDGTVPGGLSPDRVEPPDDISVEDWESWTTWANTIVGGFLEAPMLCTRLLRLQSAYEPEFVEDVREATENCRPQDA